MRAGRDREAVLAGATGVLLARPDQRDMVGVALDAAHALGPPQVFQHGPAFAVGIEIHHERREVHFLGRH